MTDHSGFTPLHYASLSGKIEMVKLLLIKHHLSVNSESLKKVTPLYWAIQSNNPSIVSLLLSHGAKVNQNYFDSTPLRRAVEINNVEMVKLLVKEGGNVNEVYPHSFNTPLSLAVGLGSPVMIDLLLQLGAKDERRKYQNEGLTLLALAAAEGKLESIKVLINNNNNNNIDNNNGVNERDVNGKTALHHAVISGGNEEIVELLIKIGAKVDARDKHGFTPLFYSSDVEMIKKLLEGGADVNNDLVLFHSTVTGKEEVVEELIKNGVEVNKKNKKGQTALFFSYNNINIFNQLINGGANPHAVDNNNNTILHMFAERENNDFESEVFIRRVLELGVDVNARNNELITPIMTSSLNALGPLLEGGAEVNAKDKEGRTALHHALLQGKEEKVEVLLASGADENIRGKDGMLPVDIARRAGLHLSVSLLEGIINYY